MSVDKALGSLGTDRTIWIDDFFDETPERLAKDLITQLEISARCHIPELEEQFVRARNRPGAAMESVTEILVGLSIERRREIKDAFHTARRTAMLSDPELSSASIDRACELLGVDPSDRWHFEQATARLPDLCKGAGDASISYVVDLKDAIGSPIRGLDILSQLARLGSKGTAFILTNEAGMADEAQKELELRRQLRMGQAGTDEIDIPLCVIAKVRLLDAADDADIQKALTIALKRAGLRRSVHEVLWQARGTLSKAFEDAAGRLTRIPPEQLESIVVKRGYQEGVSELHVIERALTAHMAKTLREMFGVDDAVRKSAERMRSLRGIPLHELVPPGDEHLAAFYEAEVWESGTLLNKALSPIASGDVFELDADEPTIKAKRRYLLLGQPCDVAIRPREDRRQDTAFLVCMKVVGGDRVRTGDRDLTIPFAIDGERWELQFRTTTVARLSILDLASFREDGKVQIDLEQERPQGLLDGLARIYAGRTDPPVAILRKAIADDIAAMQAADAQEAETAAASLAETGSAMASQAGVEAPANDDAPVPAPAVKKKGSKKTKPPKAMGTVVRDAVLQLTFSAGDDFKNIHHPYLGEATQPTRDGRVKEAPTRVTWRLRRCGRIRMPYSASFLEHYIGNISRRAFDVDYMSEVFASAVIPPDANSAQQAGEVQIIQLDTAESTVESHGA